jgi:S-DNA-T family DNA segregation ATPase FtsK/SpoIIIE
MAKSKKKSKIILKEIWAVIFISLGVLFLLAILDNLGDAGRWMNLFSLKLFGIGIYIFPFLLISIGIFLLLNTFIKWSLASLIGIILLFFSLEGLIHISILNESQINIPSSEGGGILGLTSTLVFRVLLGDIGTRIVLSSIFLISILITFQFSLSDVFNYLRNIIYFIFKAENSIKSKKTNSKKSNKVSVSNGNSLNTLEESPEIENKTIKERSKFQINRGSTDENNSVNIKIDTKKTKEIKRPEDQDFSLWKKPNIHLLENGKSIIHVPDKELLKIGEKIVEKLAYFKVGVSMDSAFVGPTVTQFALQPDATIKLNKITSLKNELALALSAESVRIEAPIPGKNLVGIEIPNTKRSIVRLKEILKSKEFSESNGSLRLCLGKNVSGNARVEALDEMPHLLIAGATGSGKSIGMNSFLISMLFENSPADLRFIMIDPKRVELMPYEGIPHLLTPVITDSTKALSALRWSVSEMMKRLNDFSKVGARNISEYNSIMKDRFEKKQAENKNLYEKSKNHINKPKVIPKIVIVIDELADLMMREHKKETESMICRIAQMARAVGMHLIIATQRPSVDVITGLIKANIPTRIAFSVTSSIDSRTVLDSIGAEDLLGKGDMLFTNPKTSRPQRIQGVFIDGQEIEKVVRHLKITMSDVDFFADHISLDDAPNETESPVLKPNKTSSGHDEMLEEALEVIRSTGKASASLLQRRLSVGYARAARILDEMEELGYIGPSQGAKARKIFL